MSHTQKSKLSPNTVHYTSELYFRWRLYEHNLLEGNVVKYFIFMINVHFYVVFDSTTPFRQHDKYDIFDQHTLLI